MNEDTIRTRLSILIEEDARILYRRIVIKEEESGVAYSMKLDKSYVNARLGAMRKLLELGDRFYIGDFKLSYKARKVKRVLVEMTGIPPGFERWHRQKKD